MITLLNHSFNKPTLILSVPVPVALSSASPLISCNFVDSTYHRQPLTVVLRNLDSDKCVSRNCSFFKIIQIYYSPYPRTFCQSVGALNVINAW